MLVCFFCKMFPNRHSTRLGFGFALWFLEMVAFFLSAQAHATTVLVLGIKKEGAPATVARAALAQHLVRMGETALAPNLSVSELFCSERDCLSRLGKRFNTQHFLGGEIFPNDRAFLLRFWLYDLQTDMPILIEERCVECGEEQLLATVARGAGRLVDELAGQTGRQLSEPVAPQGPAPVSHKRPQPDVPGNEPTSATAGPATDSPPPNAVAKPRCVHRTNSFERGVFAGALSALGLVALASGIGLSAKDGDLYLPADGERYPADLVNHFSRTAGYLYAASAVGIVGGGLTWVPWQRLGHRNLPDCPVSPAGRWTFRRGLAVGASGSLTVVGLAVSSALMGFDGKTWDYNRVGTPIPYQTRTAGQVGFGLTAVFAMGLGLSLAIP